MIHHYNDVLSQMSITYLKDIRLRSFTLDDAPDVLAYGSDALTMKYLVWEGISTLREAEDAINGHYLKNPCIFAIELMSIGRCIGCIDLRPDPAHDKAGFGYVLNRAYWNHGYMTQAFCGLIDISFRILDINRLEATHYTGNEGSGRVMMKCGMVFEGIGRQEVIIKGIYRDVVHYAILKEDWIKAYT